MRVLKKGSNGNDVKRLKHYLNLLVTPSPGLDEANGLFDEATAGAVMSFKQARGISTAALDGTVDGPVWAEIGKAFGSTLPAIRPEKVVGAVCLINDDPTGVPNWLYNMSRIAVDGPLNIDVDLFFQAYVSHFGLLSEDSMRNLYALIKFIDLDPEVVSRQAAAYMLATVLRECGDGYKPIEEWGKGAGKDYGKEVAVKGSDGKTYKNKYYGRGYVQLTWKSNYEKMSKAMGLGDELVIHPEKALVPETAYKIFSLWMTRGYAANGKTIYDYTGGNKPNFKGARYLVNGQDHAAEIAANAVKFDAILQASLK